MSEKLISFLGYNNTFYYTENVLSTDGNKITRMRRHLSEMSESIVFRFVYTLEFKFITAYDFIYG